MSAELVDRDERTIAVEHASYRWAYHVMSYGALLIVIYRGLALHQTAWDVFALVLIGGAVPIAYQFSHRVLTRRWMMTAVLTLVAAAIAAAAIAWARG
jgi:hypothetical protein